MAFPFIKNGMANPLDILVLRKERQNELLLLGKVITRTAIYC